VGEVIMADTYMLTTVDNPFDPFTQFEEWMVWDERAGYYTLSYLDRIAKLSNDVSDADQELAIKNAIDSIVKENVSGMWRKVKENGEIVP
jgi:hypothetical protein